MKILVVTLLLALTLTGCGDDRERLRDRVNKAACVELQQRYDEAVEGHNDILVTELRREIKRKCK